MYLLKNLHFNTSLFKKDSIRPLPLAGLGLVCAVIAGTGIFFLPSPPALSAANEQPTIEAQAGQLPSQLSPSPAAELLSPAAAETGQDLNEQHFQTPSPGDSPVQEQQCHELADRLHTFFSDLDKKEYIQDFQLGVPAQQYFLDLMTKLLNNPPVVSRESDDLYTILKNMAHFFRVIGGKNIIIIKGILDRERENIEDVAADLYLWTTGEECRDDVFPFQAQVDKLYEYAGFFLNSMGGRSYLFRRDSRSRLLVNYYSILLINRANKEGINQHGIDIKPLLPITTSEIETSSQLIYKEDYLDGLYELIEQYQ